MPGANELPKIELWGYPLRYRYVHHKENSMFKKWIDHNDHPGTGKTNTAQSLPQTNTYPALNIELSQINNTYTGETEKETGQNTSQHRKKSFWRSFFK